ncbi:MAG: KamA family radical SAM protein [Firmicutes bacterium]|nr:KamA family radical SAM protein [Bacillota bacterium]
MTVKFYANGHQVKDYLQLHGDEAEVMDKIAEQYPMLTNDYYLSLIDPTDPDDPIRKLSIPSAWEIEEGGDVDTSGEGDNTVVPGMQHKYRQTALILSSNACYMYCRHCFRKRMVGITDEETAKRLELMTVYVQEHPEINNILITGGDSFANSNAIIRQYLDHFADMQQLDLIRFGTRVPVVYPQRIYDDAELLDMLREYCQKKQLYIITQFNHPREVTPEAIKAVKALMNCGLLVKNQTVLLRGINDSAEVLGELLDKLTACGVVPYYVFQCRPVRGVLNHFQVPLAEGYKIVDGAKALQNGQGKCIRYAMSHYTGKIEIIGELANGEFLFKYHQAKDVKDENRIFTQKLTEGQAWL